MANKAYPIFIQRRLTGVSTEDLSSAGVNVKAVLVDTSAYTYAGTHEFLSDIAVGARIATSGNLANKTVTVIGNDDVRFDCDDFTITVGASQPSCEALVYYIDTGSAATSRLIKYVDTTSGLPYTPPSGGGTVQIQVSASGILEVQNP